MSIEEAIEQYLLWKSTHTTSAFKSYRVRLKHFKQYIGQDREITSISGDEIIQYHNKMATDGMYQNSTIAYSGYILKDFIKFWSGRGLTNLNPLEIKPMKFISPTKDVVTKADFEEMCECLSKSSFVDLTKLLVLHLLWDTGIRVSELCDIKLSDLREPNKDGIRSCMVRTRKTMRYNLVAWSKETNNLLNDYLGVRLCICQESPFLIISPERPIGKKITTRTIERWIKSICNRSMIEKNITPHSFRHGKAHYMLDNGANVRDVQAVLRHVNPQSSFNYMTLNETRYLEIATKYISG